MTLRIIPTLIVESGSAYHTINFKKNLYLGDPINICRIYNDKNCDEIAIMDISKGNKSSLLSSGKLDRLTESVFIPISYGGSLTTIDEVDKVFACGVDKVILKHSSKNSIDLAKKISKKYGVQSVILSLNFTDRPNFFYKNKFLRIKTLNEVITNLDQYAFGELLIQFVDCAGTKQGINIGIANKIRNLVKKPIIYSGGIRSIIELKNLHDLGFDAAAVSSMFTLHHLTGTPLISYISDEDRDKFMI